VLLAALSAGQKAGIAGMGAAFIVFALASSFLLPRYRPNFPGRRVGAYVGLVVCFVAARMAVVVFVGRENSDAKAAESTTAGTSPGSTAPAPAPAGNPAAGKAVFLANGCSACHTFKPAGATGTVGPDLDHLAADAAKANRGSLAEYTTESIVTPNAYVVPGFPAGVMPQNFGTKLTKTQIADLVAFLTKPS
jgi:mono/diheme cytochrome c family protein